MLSSVLLFILAIACIMVGLFLVIGTFPGVPMLLREGLAAAFFLVAFYMAFGFAAETWPRENGEATRRQRNDERLDELLKLKRRVRSRRRRRNGVR